MFPRIVIVGGFAGLALIEGLINKFMVGLNWAISYFSYEKSNRLIIRNYKNRKRKEASSNE